MQNRETFQICRKNSKSQVSWPHNGLKYFFRFFLLRISQFEKINEKKISKIFKFSKKILSLRSGDPAMGNFGPNFFYCIFGIRMLQFVKKSKKKFFFDFLTLGDDHWWRHHKGMWPLEAKLDFWGRGDLHGSKGLC